MQDHEEDAPKPVQSVTHSVFRVLEAEIEAHAASEKKSEITKQTTEQFDARSSADRENSDFASDFADPSLLFVPSSQAPSELSDNKPEDLPDHADDLAADDSDFEETDEENASDFQVLEAQEDVPEEDEPEPIVGPGLQAKPVGGKPILCLMGEFSAGKSTLSNLLIQTTALPVNVTATQLPPVWISKGDDAPYRVGLDGQEFDIELDKIEEISVNDTAYIRIFHNAELLDHCDLIDMPGISDPNMDAEVWQRVITYADAVIWCSHATQAWRQSEAAVWSMLPPALYANSLLLLTRMDKILSERDQTRVAKRVGRETVGLFKEIFPISLTRALAANGDEEKWKSSGAEDFTNALHALLEEISEQKDAGEAPSDEAQPEGPSRFVMPSRIRPKPLLARRTNSRPAPTPLPPL